MKKLKVYALISLAIISMKISAMDDNSKIEVVIVSDKYPNPQSPNLKGMSEILIDKYYGNLPKTPQDTAAKLDKMDSKTEKIVQEFFNYHPWVEKLTIKHNSYQSSIDDTKAGIAEIKKEAIDGQSLPILPVFKSNAFDYYALVKFNEEEGTIVFEASTQYSQIMSVREKYGLYVKNPTPEQEAMLADYYYNNDSFQTIGRALEKLRFEIIKRIEGIKNVFTSDLFLVKYPWASNDIVCDSNYCIIEAVPCIRPVDKKFISHMDQEMITEMFKIVMFSGIWNFSERWYIDDEGHSFIIDLRPQSKHSPDHYKQHVDPLLNPRTGIEAFSKYLDLNSEQFNYLIEAIQEEPNISEDFRKTLLIKAFGAHGIKIE